MGILEFPNPQTKAISRTQNIFANVDNGSNRVEDVKI
jgi:hypothetical protein